MNISHFFNNILNRIYWKIASFHLKWCRKKCSFGLKKMFHFEQFFTIIIFFINMMSENYGVRLVP